MTKYMTRRQKKEWVAALRSGRFKQGFLYLHHLGNDSYCVMGVVNALNPGLSFYLPQKGLTGGELAERSLIAMNDSQKMTFPEMADWIEENVSTSIFKRRKYGMLYEAS